MVWIGDDDPLRRVFLGAAHVSGQSSITDTRMTKDERETLSKRIIAADKLGARVSRLEYAIAKIESGECARVNVLVDPSGGGHGNKAIALCRRFPSMCEDARCRLSGRRNTCAHDRRTNYGLTDRTFRSHEHTGRKRVFAGIPLSYQIRNGKCGKKFKVTETKRLVSKTSRLRVPDISLRCRPHSQFVPVARNKRLWNQQTCP